MADDLDYDWNSFQPGLKQPTEDSYIVNPDTGIPELVGPKFPNMIAPNKQAALLEALDVNDHGEAYRDENSPAYSSSVLSAGPDVTYRQKVEDYLIGSHPSPERERFVKGFGNVADWTPVGPAVDAADAAFRQKYADAALNALFALPMSKIGKVGKVAETVAHGFMDGGSVLGRAIALSRQENERMARKDGGKTYSKEEREFEYKGLTIGIQTSKGEKRKHHGDVKFPVDYGYIGDTEDNDDMNVDVYMGPNKDSDKAVVINQYRKSGKFDEHKVMLGFKSQAAAVKAYKDSWPKKKAEVRYGDSVAMSVEDLKKWLEYGNTKKPIKKSVLEQAIMLSKKKA